jgi:hypothetical protein
MAATGGAEAVAWQEARSAASRRRILVRSAPQAVGLVRPGHGNGLTVLTTEDVTVDADAPEIPVGIDGETVMMAAPVRCAIRPGAQRVVVPRNRPGVPAPMQPLEWPRLRQLASFRGQPDGESARSQQADRATLGQAANPGLRPSEAARASGNPGP